MKLGIGSYTYMWSIGFADAAPSVPMTTLGLLHKARELGVAVVQYGPNLPLSAQDETELNEVLAFSRDCGIEIEMGTKGFETRRLSSEIEFAHRIGVRLLRTVSDYERRAAPPTVADLCGTLAPFAPILEAAGVSLAIENAAIPAAILAEALESIASPKIGVTLDTVNSLAIPEGTEEVARLLAPHVLCLHVKDFSVDRIWHMMGFTVEGRAAGQGQLNVPWLLRLLREAGRSPNAILELWPPRQATLQETISLEQAWARESISYLRGLIPE